jgi:hypothetical protein
VARANVMVKMSDRMKEHLETYAKANKLTLSEFVRRACAKATGYDLTVDDALEVRGRPAKYQSDEERLEAKRRRNREAAERQQLIVEAVMRDQRLDGAAALEQWLRERGLLDEDGKAVTVAAE